MALFAWIPALEGLLEQLPADGYILNGRWQWPDNKRIRQANGTFIVIDIDPTQTENLNHSADLTVEFRKNEFRIHSLLGYLAWPYPTHTTITLNQTTLKPWWYARKPFLLGAAALALMLTLGFTWTALGFFYLWPAALIGFFANRTAPWTGYWRLAIASLLPGALLVSACTLLYGLGKLSLVEFAFAQAIHFAVGWIYLLVAPFRLPKTDSPGLNPFGNPPPAPSDNPFAPPKSDPGTTHTANPSNHFSRI